MKLSAFKEIIKETVREAVREELDLILNTDVGSSIKGIQKEAIRYSPISDILKETQKSMSPTEYKQMVIDPTSTNNPLLSEPFRPNQSPDLMEQRIIPSAPVVGIDINQLPFLKGAKEKLSLMDEKQRQRNGG